MNVSLQARNHEGLSVAAKKAIGEQLERLLASPYMSHSKRLPTFLRFVVEHTLAGEVDDIKERTLGIEVFGKDASYDTALDPIVRVTAAEIRKRVAQYYQDSAHDEELRITLPSGSYIPQFHSPKGKSIHGLPEIDAIPAGTPEHVPAPATQARRRWLLAAVGVAAAGLLVWGAVVFWQRTNRAAVDFFWQPVLSSNEPVLLCVPEQPNDFAPNVLNPGNLPYQVVPTNARPPGIGDLSAVIKVAGILQSRGKLYALKGEAATALDDLQRGPTVFVGAYDNVWTLRLTNPLHYHFANDADMMHQWIVDSTAPDKTRWMIDRGAQMASNNYRDYAIVARFTDPNTGKLAVILAGIGAGGGGTRAAGEFITDSAHLTQLMRAAQAAGDKKNMEFVISTQIIGGEPGAPRMEASYFW